MKVNLILGTRLFRADILDMIDEVTPNSESAIRGSRINLAASPLGTARVNWIWAPISLEVIST